MCCMRELLEVISKLCSGFQASVLVSRRVCVCVCSRRELLEVISKFCFHLLASVLVFNRVCVIVGGNSLK